MYSNIRRCSAKLGLQCQPICQYIFYFYKEYFKHLFYSDSSEEEYNPSRLDRATSTESESEENIIHHHNI